MPCSMMSPSMPWCRPEAAIGGVASGARNRGILVFAMPGSPRAVHSVMQELVIPVLPHAIWELRGRPSVNEPRQSEVD